MSVEEREVLKLAIESAINFEAMYYNNTLKYNMKRKDFNKLLKIRKKLKKV